MKKNYLKKALDLAEKNIGSGGGPFGAVIVREGKIISEAANKVAPNNDPTAHAEILAIRAAADRLGTYDLSGCQLYSSAEPCPMCLGAIYWAHIDSVFFAASNEDAMKAGFDDLDIYNEMHKKPAERKIKMERDLRNEGIRIFQKWKESEDKIEY